MRVGRMKDYLARSRELSVFVESSVSTARPGPVRYQVCPREGTCNEIARCKCGKFAATSGLFHFRRGFSWDLKPRAMKDPMSTNQLRMREQKAH